MACAALALVWAAKAGARELPFADPRQLASISTPLAAAAADLDGDGDLDLVYASAFDSSLNYLENGGGPNPVFTPRFISNLASGAQSIATGDLDGDGDNDLVVAFYNNIRIDLYQNNGGSPVSFLRTPVDALAQNPRSVRSGDANNDGLLDLVATLEATSECVVYLNTGMFQPPPAPPGIPIFSRMQAAGGLSGPMAAEFADFDGDGDLDIAVAEYDSDTVSWLESDGAASPTYAKRVIASNADGAKALLPADVDGDGDIDLVSASVKGNQFVLHVNGGGSPIVWGRRVIASMGSLTASALAAGDLDLDGDLDLVFGSFTGSNLSWHESDGAATPVFAERDIDAVVNLTAEGLSSIIMADMDGDGDDDLVGAAFLDDTVFMIENRLTHRSANFEIPDPILMQPSSGLPSMATADLNGDGKLDVAYGTQGNSVVSWLRGDGQGNFAFESVGMADNVDSLATGDFQRDGDVDVVASAANGGLYLFASDGAATPAWTVTTLQAAGGAGSFSDVAVADLDGDGDLDVLATDPDDNMTWYENTDDMALTFAPRVVWAMGPGFAGRCAIGDVDSDGRLDIVSSRSNPFDFDYTLSWHRNVGGSPAVFIESVISADPDGPGLGMGPLSGIQTLGLADLDGDGDLDIALHASVPNTIAWLENTDGIGSFAIHNILTGTTFSGSNEVFALVDFDDDGDIDLVESSAPNAFVFPNDGTANPFTDPASIQFISGATPIFAIAAGDFDTDGRVDLVSAVTGSTTFTLHPNLGGQQAVSGGGLGALTLGEYDTAAIAEILVEHRGRTISDGDAEVRRLEFRFLDSGSFPLTSSQIQGLVARLSVWFDAGTPGWDPDEDYVIAQVSPVSLNASGEIAFSLPSQSFGTRFGLGNPIRFHLVAEVTPTASTQTPNSCILEFLSDRTLSREVERFTPLTTIEGSNVGPSVAVIDFVPGTAAESEWTLYE